MRSALFVFNPRLTSTTRPKRTLASVDKIANKQVIRRPSQKKKVKHMSSIGTKRQRTLSKEGRWSAQDWMVAIEADRAAAAQEKASSSAASPLHLWNLTLRVCETGQPISSSSGKEG